MNLIPALKTLKALENRELRIVGLLGALAISLFADLSCKKLDTPAASSSGTVYTSRRVFITSIQIAPPIGGLAGADAFCMARATAGGLVGTYVAWLSTSTVDAISRIPANTVWYLVDNATVAFTNTASIPTTGLRSQLKDEFGVLAATFPWTGTTAAGSNSVGQNCSDWTSAGGGPVGMIGSSSMTGTGWSTAVGAFGCAGNQPLVCFQTAP